MSADHSRSWLGEYEEAIYAAFEEGQALVQEAVERADARRRVYVDSDGCAVIAYIDPSESNDAGGEPARKEMP